MQDKYNNYSLYEYFEHLQHCVVWPAAMQMWGSSLIFSGVCGAQGGGRGAKQNTTAVVHLK